MEVLWREKMLNDENIRLALKEYICSRANKPKLLIEELRIHDGNAIADVVAVYDFMHGYEIKGETDKVSRIKIQSGYYNTSFPLLTLVTTQNHIEWAVENLECFWGIILVLITSDGIKFKHIRGAKNNPQFCKKLSLSMLWKNELLNMAQATIPHLIRKSDSRADLAEKIFSAINKKSMLSMLSQLVSDRYSETVINECNMSS